MASKVELAGGQFQNVEGDPLILGYIKMKLSSDEEVNDSLICSGIEITINLDSAGSCVAGQFVWGNDVMLPVNSYYKVTVYSAQGQIVWGPNNQQVTGTSPFDVGTWIPNSVISWVPPAQPLLLEVNGVSGSQTLLNLVAGTNVTLTDNGLGSVTVASTVPTVPNSLPTPERARFALFEVQSATGSIATPLLVTNDQLTTNDGGAGNISLNPPDVNGGSSATFSVVGGTFGLTLRSYQGQLFIYPGRRTVVRGTLRFHFDIGAAQGEYFVGITDVISGGNPRTGGMLMVGVEKVANAVIGNWILFVSNAGTVTRVDTGIPIDDNERDSFEIIMNSGTVTVSINGVLCGSATTNLPTSPMGLNWYLHGNATGAGGTCFGTIEYLYAENTTP
jgi:hypothetical protein